MVVIQLYVDLQCKSVIGKVQRRIDKEGHVVPLLTDLWKRTESSGHTNGPGNKLLDLRKIDHRIDRLQYCGVMEVVSDVQLMLKSAVQYYGFSHEVCHPHLFINLYSELRNCIFYSTNMV